MRTTLPGAAIDEWRAGGYYMRPLPSPADATATAAASTSAAASASASPPKRRRLWGICLNTNQLALGGGRKQLDWLEVRSPPIAHRCLLLVAY